MIIKQIHPSKRIVCFDEFKHIYFMEDKPYIIFTSVTKFINTYFPKFDFNLISLRYAEKNNLDVEEVRQAWKDKTKLGTKVHNYASFLLTRKQIYATISNSGEEKHYFKQVKQAVKALYFFGLQVECSECILGDPLWKIGGTTDIILRYQDSIHIYDWKTSNEIKTENVYQTALPPIAHLSDTNFNKYSLQLNLYEYIMRNNGYFPWAKQFIKRIIHVTPTTYTFIDVPDLQKEIKNMLKMKELT